MSKDDAITLFINEIEDKKFTKKVVEWFEEKTKIKVGTRYQRKKKATFWWSIIVYCANNRCKLEYKLKSNIKALKLGESTDVMIFCKEDKFCNCGKLSSC